MPDTKTLHEKYVELIEAGYIAPINPAPPLEMPTAFVYVPTYISDHTEPYDNEFGEEERNAKLVRDPEGDSEHR